MSEFKEDIIIRLKQDFKDTDLLANRILQEAITQNDYLKTDRIIRCIIYLSKGDIKELEYYINVAKEDPRDVMLWAEYENLNANQTPKRIRDFNKIFEKSAENVKE